MTLERCHMEVVTWTDDFLIGVDLIDNQHKELFNRLNALGSALWDGKGKDVVGEHIEFLSEYVKQHFADEEALMLQNNYPGYDEQKDQHEKYVEYVASMRKKLESGETTSSDAIEVLNQTCDWLRNHIKVVDARIGDFLSGEKG